MYIIEYTKHCNLRALLHLIKCEMYAFRSNVLGFLSKTFRYIANWNVVILLIIPVLYYNFFVRVLRFEFPSEEGRVSVTFPYWAYFTAQRGEPSPLHKPLIPSFLMLIPFIPYLQPQSSSFLLLGSLHSLLLSSIHSLSSALFIPSSQIFHFLFSALLNPYPQLSSFLILSSLHGLSSVLFIP